MLEPHNEKSVLPEIDAKKKLSIEVVIAYLDERLPDFPQFFKARHSTTYTTDSEPIISQVLCPFLRNYRKPDEVLLFDFEREWKKSRSAVDFAVIDVKSFKETSERPKPFFTKEAKRLPPPEDNKGKSREREYVQSSSGGIQRYKKGLHGAGLLQSAMIGYIQKETCSYWHTEINKWIEDLRTTNKDKTTIHWDSSDLLKEVRSFGKTRKYNSKNTRIIDSKPDSIELHHYLMELT